MKSYIRFRKLLGSARSRVVGSRLLSMLMLAALLIVLSPAGGAQRTSAAESEATLFQNVRIFDGKSTTLSPISHVLIRGNKIERISASTIAVDAGTRVIDGGGRTLMPGLIDVHWHAMLIRPTPAEAILGDVGYNNLIAGDEAKDTLMRGFTTVRDVGGPVFGLKHAIDDGTIVGPRIYPSGAMITVTSGHGDSAN
jgi:imidazolonepropionase-like amidohydrolase